MENDFTFSKNYLAMFNDAMKIKNIYQMDSVFKELCAEVGIIDPASEVAQAAAGKALAELLNDRDANVGGKKV